MITFPSRRRGKSVSATNRLLGQGSTTHCVVFEFADVSSIRCRNLRVAFVSHKRGIVDDWVRRTADTTPEEPSLDLVVIDSAILFELQRALTARTTQVGNVRLQQGFMCAL